MHIQHLDAKILGVPHTLCSGCEVLPIRFRRMALQKKVRPSKYKICKQELIVAQNMQIHHL